MRSSAASPATECQPASEGAFRAVEATFDRCSAALFRFVAVRTGDTHLAHDIMQQLWLQACRHGAGIPENELEYWLRTVARNLVRSHWRARGRRPPHVAMPDPATAATLAEQLVERDIPADLLARREVRDQIKLAITGLSAEDQDLIVGCYFHEQSHAELGERFGLSTRAVEGRLYRARQALRRRLAHLEDDDA